MATEIERKFLVKEGWNPPGGGTVYRQGYLSTDPRRNVRVRISDTDAFFTIKGKTEGLSRPEFEYAIPAGDAEQLLKLCLPHIIEKTRYRIPADGLVWEVDVFHGVNAGLVLAEVELEAEDQPFEKPAWVGREVSGDKRYYNAWLSAHPYGTWEEK